MPVDEILSVEAFPDGTDAPVYLSGSIIAGLGNAWSDVDVFVLTDRRPVGSFVHQGGENVVVQHFVRGRRLDFEFWQPSDVRRLAERLERLILGAGTHLTRTYFTFIEECFLHRLRIGAPLLNESRFREFQSLFDWQKLAAYQAQECIRQADAVFEDACGMIEADDISALFSVRQLLDLSLAAYLHRRGNTDPTAKWQARYLERFDDGSPTHEEFSRSFWKLQFPGPEMARRGNASRPYLEECIRFSRRVTSWVQA